MLGELAADLHARRLRLAISNPSERVHATFQRSGLLDIIGERKAALDMCIGGVCRAHMYVESLQIIHAPGKQGGKVLPSRLSI